MLAKLGKMNATQIGSALMLPERPDELLNAELAHADLAAKLTTTQADFEKLSSHFNLLGVRRGDGTLFPDSGREGVLADLFCQCENLKAGKEQARRRVGEALRAFSEQASEYITPAADAVSEEAIAKIDEAMRLVEMLSDIATEARKAGLTIKHAQIGRALNIVRQLYAARGALVPTPVMGARR